MLKRATDTGIAHKTAAKEVPANAVNTLGILHISSPAASKSSDEFHFRSEGSFTYETFELSPIKRNQDTLHRAIVVSNLQEPLAQSIARKGAFKIVTHILPILNRDETTYAGGCLWPHPPASVAAPAAEMSGIISR